MRKLILGALLLLSTLGFGQNIREISGTIVSINPNQKNEILIKSGKLEFNCEIEDCYYNSNLKVDFESLYKQVTNHKIINIKVKGNMKSYDKLLNEVNLDKCYIIKNK